jgi:hypothetical protein
MLVWTPIATKVRLKFEGKASRRHRLPWSAAMSCFALPISFQSQRRWSRLLRKQMLPHGLRRIVYRRDDAGAGHLSGLAMRLPRRQLVGKLWPFIRTRPPIEAAYLPRSFRASSHSFWGSRSPAPASRMIAFATVVVSGSLRAGLCGQQARAWSVRPRMPPSSEQYLPARMPSRTRFRASPELARPTPKPRTTGKG